MPPPTLDRCECCGVQSEVVELHSSIPNEVCPDCKRMLSVAFVISRSNGASVNDIKDWIELIIA